MALRPTWKGSISFGLVNIPVSLYLAAQSQRVSFHLLHEKDHGRVRYKRVCELDGKEVGWDDIVKGYEYAKGSYLPITDEDLDSIDIGLAHTVEIEQFVGADEIDPFFYDRPYFLEPARGAERAYALLRKALEESGRVGIARIVFRERESLAAVRPRGEGLALETLRFASEIRDEAGLNLPRGAVTDLPSQQVELALTLIDRLTAPWEPERFVDRYDEAVARLIERKLEGLPAAAPAAPAPPMGAVIDLAEVLRRSLREAEQPQAGEGEAEEARRSARARKPARGTRAAAPASQAARRTARKGRKS